MRKLLLRSLTISAFAIMLILLSQNSYAQKSDGLGSPEEKATEWTDWLSNKMDLSSTQYTRTYEIYLKYANQYKDSKDGNGPLKGGFEPYRKKANNEIYYLLTAEQKKKWKNM